MIAVLSRLLAPQSKREHSARYFVALVGKTVLKALLAGFQHWKHTPQPRRVQGVPAGRGGGVVGQETSKAGWNKNEHVWLQVLVYLAQIYTTVIYKR